MAKTGHGHPHNSATEWDKTKPSMGIFRLIQLCHARDLLHSPPKGGSGLRSCRVIYHGVLRQLGSGYGRGVFRRYAECGYAPCAN